MSDDEDKLVNTSSDEMLHDDFELGAIYSGLNKEVPKMERILLGAKKFGDSHRHIINQFCSEPIMSAKKMNLMFAKHFTTVKLQKHPEVVMKIQATPEDSRELTKAIVRTINNEDGVSKKSFKPWRFVISTDEKTPNEFVTMTGCSRNSSIISDANDLTKAERALFFAIVEELMTLDGRIPYEVITDLTKHEPHKVIGHKLDIFMNRMQRQKYFYIDSDREFIEISPRTLVELEVWLRAKFGDELKLCTLCRKIISRPVYTAECVKCKALCHYNCFKNATVISRQEFIQCGKCNDKIFSGDVDDALETRKLEAAARARTRINTPRQVRITPIRTLTPDDEATDGDVTKEAEDVATTAPVDVTKTEPEDDEDEDNLPRAPLKRKNKRRTIIDSDSD